MLFKFRVVEKMSLILKHSVHKSRVRNASTGTYSKSLKFVNGLVVACP